MCSRQAAFKQAALYKHGHEAGAEGLVGYLLLCFTLSLLLKVV
jgi:hypothetical protein